MHVAPTCVVSGEGPTHFGSYVHRLSLHFCKRLFLGLEPMTSWSGRYGQVTIKKNTRMNNIINTSWDIPSSTTKTAGLQIDFLASKITSV
jgi:hypothetical protein